MRTAAAVVLCAALWGGPAAALAPSNLDVVTQTAREALADALKDLAWPDPQDGTVSVTAAAPHPANWLFEHLLVADLLDRGLAVTVEEGGARRLSWRVVDLDVNARSGLISGSVARRCRVVVRVELRVGDELVWSGDGHAERDDHVPKSELDAVQHARFAFAKTDLEQRTWGKFVEPVIITTVLGSLIYLFFSNR